MLASSFGDPVIGLDIHYELVPTPAPTPTPIPNPFTGVIFDPIGLAVGLAITNAINFVTGAPPAGPVVYWGAFPATNTGTEAKHVPGHILIPPGTAWAPFPKTPKPVIHPDEKPKPPNPVKPEDDAVCVFGSKTVTVMGSNAVRLGDILLSCSEPVRLPSSVVMAVPKGAPILIGGPPSLDIVAAAFASLRTRFVSDSLYAALSRMKPSRFRSVLMWAACKLTGHPVDVATGRVVTGFTDVSFQSPVPLKAERIYSSGCASRDSILGHGWSLSLQEVLWLERGRIVYLGGDGREIEFDTFDFPDHVMYVGASVRHPFELLTLRRVETDLWQIVTRDGLTKTFAAVSPTTTNVWNIVRTTSRCGRFANLFHYSITGRLEQVFDASGRIVRLEYNAAGRLKRLLVPRPNRHDAQVHREYSYDDAGDLVAVTDANGDRWEFEYASHLLTRETNRTGHSFYFSYDGLGEDAWCVRTWGDGGIYDHELVYDKKKRVTMVTNSLGHTTTYFFNPLGLVEKQVDALGSERTWRWNEFCQLVGETDEAGNEWRYAYNQDGDILAQFNPDGTSFHFVRSLDGRVVAIRHSEGLVWHFVYDSEGCAIAASYPSGTHADYGYTDGLLSSIRDPGASDLHLEYDDELNLVSAVSPDGSQSRWAHDAWGKVTSGMSPDRVRWDHSHDPEGRLTRLAMAGGDRALIVRDQEGRVRSIERGGSVSTFEYAFLNNVARMRTGSTEISYRFDTEGKIRDIRAANQSVAALEYDARGDVIAETNFNGAVTRYRRDRTGRIVGVHRDGRELWRISYDGVGRIAQVDEADGSFTTYTYDRFGLLESAATMETTVRFERDSAGRVIREWQNDDWIEFTFDEANRCSEIRTSFGRRISYGWDVGRTLRDLQYRDATGKQWSCGFKYARPVGIETWYLPNDLSVLWRRNGDGRLYDHQVLLHDRSIFKETFDWHADGRLRRVSAQDRVFDVDEAGGVTSTRRSDGRDSRIVDAFGNAHRSEDAHDRRYGTGGQLIESDEFTCDYDSSGRLVRKVDRLGRTWRYEWSPGGNLKRVETPDHGEVIYDYDAFGRRVSKRVRDVETRWIWNGDSIIHEGRRRGIDATRVSTYAFIPDEHFPLACETDDEQTIALVSDARGAPVAAYGSNGVLRWAAEATMWGEYVITTPKESRFACPLRMPGQYADPECGLYYNRHRYYDPGLGTYISPDPAELWFASSQYMYVRNSLTMLDPLGLAQTGVLRVVDVNDPSNPLWEGSRQRYNHNSGVHWEPKSMAEFDEALRRNPELPDGRRLADALNDPNIRVRFDSLGSTGAAQAQNACRRCARAIQNWINGFAGQFPGRVGTILGSHWGMDEQPFRCDG